MWLGTREDRGGEDDDLLDIKQHESLIKIFAEHEIRKSNVFWVSIYRFWTKKKAAFLSARSNKMERTTFPTSFDNFTSTRHTRWFNRRSTSYVVRKRIHFIINLSQNLVRFLFIKSMVGLQQDALRHDVGLRIFIKNYKQFNKSLGTYIVVQRRSTL